MELTRENPTRKRSAVTPVFPKPVDESWWLVIGNEETGELVALKRLGPIVKATTTTVTFYTPDTEGQHSYSLYLMSATYLGLDQQVPFRFTCVHGEERDVVDDDDDDEGEQGSARSSGRTKANSAKLQPTPAAFPSLSEVTQPQKKQLAPEHKQ